MRELVLSSWDDVAAWLRERRAAVGNPTYAELATRVRQQRLSRGLPPDEARISRTTVFDCFKDGRRRMDLDLLADLGLALGLRGEDARLWRSACAGVQSNLDSARIVAVTEQLPQTPYFVGRGDELRQLTGRAGLWVVSGMAGVGKTQLVLRAAQSWLHGDRAARTLVADLRGHHATRIAADGEAMLEELVRMLSREPVRPSTPAEHRQRLARLLHEHRAVLVLDDAASTAQVAAIVPTGVTTPVFVTSRRRLELEGAEQVDLDVPAPDDCLRLLGAVVGSEPIDSDGDAANDIVALTGRLPLALDVTARRIAGQPEWSLADHRDAFRQEAGLLRLPGPVAPALGISYLRLSSDAQRALRLMADQPATSLGNRAVAALLDLDVAAAEATLIELAAASMAAYDGRVRLHDLVRVFALGESVGRDRPAERQAARGRLLDHYLAMAGEVVVATGLPPMVSRADFDPPSTEMLGEEAMAWFSAERENLLTLADPEHSATRPGFARRLSACLVRLLDVQGWFTDAVHLHSLALHEARADGDRPGEARSEALLGQVLHRLGDLDDATTRSQRALELVDTAVDPDTSASAASNLGVIAWLRGDFDSADGWFGQALETIQVHDTTRSEAGVLGNLGAVAVELGDLELGAERHRRAYEAAEAEGNLQVAATALLNLGNLESFTGRYADAEASARRACAIAGDLGAHTVLSPARVNLGSALTYLGRHDEAREVLDAVLADSRDHADPLHETGALLALAELDLELGDLAAARSAADGAERLATSNQMAFWSARHRDVMGRIALAEGDIGAAREHFEVALAAFEEMGSLYAAKMREQFDSL